MSNKLISEDFLLAFADMMEPKKLWYGRKLLDSKMLRYLVKQAPAVDAVEVVWCKDCKWRNTKGCPYMNFNASAREDFDFCSDGERRTDV